MVELVVLSVAGCPHAALLRQRLADVLGEHTDLRIRHQIIGDEAEAARWGMFGSPTLLVDGRDPFAVRGTRPSLSCRIYRGEDATADGVPTPAQLRAVLEAAR